MYVEKENKKVRERKKESRRRKKERQRESERQCVKQRERERERKRNRERWKRCVRQRERERQATRKIEKESFCGVRVDYTPSSRGSTREGSNYTGDTANLATRVREESQERKREREREEAPFSGGGPRVTARGANITLLAGKRVMYLRRTLRNVQGAG